MNCSAGLVLETFNPALHGAVFDSRRARTFNGYLRSASRHPHKTSGESTTGLESTADAVNRRAAVAFGRT